jgi:hypothetical protein
MLFAAVHESGIGTTRTSRSPLDMSVHWGIVLQKSPSSLCEIEICNDRIGARAPLNRCCAFAPDLESMLRDKMLKILLQHNPNESGKNGKPSVVLFQKAKDQFASQSQELSSRDKSL